MLFSSSHAGLPPPPAPQGEAHHPPHIRSAGLQHRRAGAPPAGDEPKTTPRDGGRARGGGAGEEEKGGEVLTVCLDMHCWQPVTERKKRSHFDLKGRVTQIFSNTRNPGLNLSSPSDSAF